MLIDTNIIIYAVHPDYHELRRWLIDQLPAYPIISRVESLGFHRLTAGDRSSIEAVFDALNQLYLSAETFDLAIRLRQQRKMSLGDSLIAATALEHHLTLATANVDDFLWVDGLKVLNPLKQP